MLVLSLSFLFFSSKIRIVKKKLRMKFILVSEGDVNLLLKTKVKYVIYN